MIDAKTKLFGLLGNPVGHSMSPFMHNIFLQQCGINGVYLAFAVESGQVGAAMQGMYALGVQGCNVTIPHKEAVIPYLCGMSKAAEVCGAVNTLIYTPEGYYGDNTDGAGLLAALEVKHGWKAAGQNILLVDAEGQEIETAGVKVKVKVPVESIDMSDDTENGDGVCGHIISLIYKGDHYHYVVRTKDDYDFHLHDEYLWNENDYVRLIIPKESIEMSLLGEN